VRKDDGKDKAKKSEHTSNRILFLVIFCFNPLQPRDFASIFDIGGIVVVVDQ